MSTTMPLAQEKRNGVIQAPADLHDKPPAKAKRPPAEAETQAKGVTIEAPNFQTAGFVVVGIGPYVQSAFGAKAREKMKLAQEAGSTAKKGSKKEPKDFRQCFEEATHRLPDGGYGIPAPAFRNACIDACRMCGFAMTRAKMSIFIEADGFDPKDGTPLVRFLEGEPEYLESVVRNDSGVCDIRARPMWQPGWKIALRVRFDADQFTIHDVANLLLRAGEQVGVGEGRPFSKNSAGLGWGQFTIKGQDR
jgi:hypothetical protein